MPCHPLQWWGREQPFAAAASGGGLRESSGDSLGTLGSAEEAAQVFSPGRRRRRRRRTHLLRRVLRAAVRHRLLRLPAVIRDLLVLRQGLLQFNDPLMTGERQRRGQGLGDKEID